MTIEGWVVRAAGAEIVGLVIAGRDQGVSLETINDYISTSYDSEVANSALELLDNEGIQLIVKREDGMYIPANKYPGKGLIEYTIRTGRLANTIARASDYLKKK